MTKLAQAMFGFNFGGQGNGVFEAKYRVYPVSFIGKTDAENGDKIFMPPSALDKLGTSKYVLDPWEIENTLKGAE